MTAGVAIGPASVVTAVIWRPTVTIPVAARCGMSRAPRRRAAVA
jgi:hypothetical protein